MSGFAALADRKHTREDSIEITPLPQIPGCHVGPATSRRRPPGRLPVPTMERCRRLEGRILRRPWAAERECMKQGSTGGDTPNARAPENSPPSRKTAEPAFGGCRGLDIVSRPVSERLLRTHSAGRRCRRAAGVQRVREVASCRQALALGRLCCPPIPSADGGGWHVHLRASESSVRVRLCGEPRLDETDAEGGRRAAMPLSRVLRAMRIRRSRSLSPRTARERVSLPLARPPSNYVPI